MRGRLQKKLLACLNQEFKARFPQFSACDPKEQYPAWSWKIASNLHLFVGVQVFAGRDQFVINLGWSENGSQPWTWLGLAEVEQTEGCERLGVLWNRARGERH